MNNNSNQQKKSIITTRSQARKNQSREMSLEHGKPIIFPKIDQKEEKQMSQISESSEEEEKVDDQKLLYKDIPEHLLPFLNKLIRNKENFYVALIMKGYYLPEYESRAVTGQFLWKVFTEEIACLKRTDIKQGYVANYVSKTQLLGYLEEKLEKSLGLDEEHLPDRQWLINYLFTIQSDHQVFSFGKSNNLEDKIIENKLKQMLGKLDFSCVKSTKRSSVFKMSKKAQMTLKKRKKEARLAKAQKRQLKQEKKLQKAKERLNQLSQEKI